MLWISSKNRTASHEKEYIFWEAFVLARKSLSTTFAVFLSHSGTTIQVVVTVLILFICYTAQASYQPFEHDVHDKMESRSLLSSTSH